MTLQGAVNAMSLEDGLGEVEPDRDNLHGGWSLHKWLPDDSHPMAHRRRTQGPSTPSGQTFRSWVTDSI
jgi:hypothetical protein